MQHLSNYGASLRSLFLIMFLLGSSLFTSKATAGIVLTLVPQSSLLGLSVGDTVTIDVTLAGVNDISPSALAYLFATIDASSTAHFGTPTVTPGPIVNANYLQIFPSMTLLDVQYDVTGLPVANTVVSDGTFFFFSMPVLTGGIGSTGTIGFIGSHVAITSDAQLYNVEIAGELTYSIQGGILVPEPSTVWLFIGMVVLTWFYQNINRCSVF